jgi:hypothetical protein
LPFGTPDKTVDRATVDPRRRLPEILFAMAWKPCSFCRGIGINFAVEFVFFLPWNPCSLWRGIFRWPRYVYEALVMFSLLIAVLMVTASNRGIAALVAQVIVVVVVRHKNEMTDPNEQLRGQLQQTWVTPTMDSDRRVLNYLLAHSSGNRVYVQWWAQAPNVDYLSPRPLLFQHWDPRSAESHSSYLVVTNSRLMDTSDAPFYAALARCGLPKLDAPPYRVYQCSST